MTATSLSERVLGDVAAHFFRAMALQGRGIAILTQSGAAEVAYTNLRTLFELYVGFRHLLPVNASPHERERLALQIRLYAMRDFNNYMEKVNFLPTESLERLRKHEAAFAEAHPDVAAEFERCWRQNKSHWLGMSRTAAIKALDPDPAGFLWKYKSYSWEAHGVLGPLLDINEAGMWTLHVHRQPQEEVARFICSQALGMMMDAWHGMRKNGWGWRTKLAP